MNHRFIYLFLWLFKSFVLSQITEPESCDNSTQCTTDSFMESTTTFYTTANISNEPPSTIPTTTTTTATTTTAANQISNTFTKPETGKICSCDITSEQCDMNCCCDKDCDDFDRSAFKFCIKETKIIDHSGLCFSQQFIYTNNTRYKISKYENGLFCIAKDNYPERLQLKNLEPIHTVEKFNRVWNRHKRYTWKPAPNVDIPIYDEQVEYKYGSYIWSYFNSTNEFKPLGFPVSLTTNLCASSRTLQYLVSFESSCLLNSPKTKSSCESFGSYNARSFCNNIKLVGNPKQLNISHIEESSLVKIRTLLCGENCVDVETLPGPVFNKSANSCRNVVSEVKMIIYHNGSSGVLDAECAIIINEVRLKSNYFAQKFSVVYEWARNETNVFKRSGTPGYHVGKPVISCNDTSVNKGKMVFHISKEIKDWISFPVANRKYECQGRTNLLFKENMMTQCYLTVNKTGLNTDAGCSQFYEKIWDVIFDGLKLNKSDSQQLEILVSSYGDPVLDNAADWVPVYLENEAVEYEMNRKAPCDEFPSGLKYQILYSYFGPFSNPQAKIIGIVAKLHNNKIKCKGNECKLKITGAVNFVDVSQQAINKFAKAPVVKIKLPQDFFYPFSSIGVKFSVNVVSFSLSLIIVSSYL